MFLLKLFLGITCFVLAGDDNMYATSFEIGKTQPENACCKKDFARICYYTNWSAYREGKGHFEPEDIHYEYCTVIVYSFIFLNETLNEVKIIDPNLDIDKGYYAKVTALRDKGLNVVTSLGGWTDSKKKYSDMMADTKLRRQFCSNLAQFLVKHNFGGVDVDIEYPATYPNDPSAGERPQDRKNFVIFLRDLRRALDKVYRTAKLKERLTLSIAVSGNRKYVEKGYDVKAIVNILDWIGVMTYDMHTKAESKTGLVAPFGPMDGEPEEYREFNVQSMMNLWVKLGAPKNKLVVGFPFYGRTFKLVNAKDNGIYAPASGDPDPGEFTKESGTLAYFEIVDKVQNEGWTVVHNNNLGSYAFKGFQWVGYDDTFDAAVKANYIRENCFYGAMYWSLDSDCFQENCPGGPDALLSTIHNVLTGAIEYTEVKNRT